MIGSLGNTGCRKECSQDYGLQAAYCRKEESLQKEKKMESAGQMKPSVDTQVVIRKHIIVDLVGGSEVKLTPR